MNIDTEISPYFDDYDPQKGYYRVLFKPAVGVQVRELNQVQSMFQSQVSRFGDNIFRRGSIVAGCNFQFFDKFPYVKLIDQTNAQQSVTPQDYVGALVKGSVTGLTGYVVDSANGFFATDPDLNTLYLRYTNSGSNNNTTAFVNNEIITVFDTSLTVRNVSVVAGGSAFANNDIPVFVSSIAISNSTGGNSFVNSSAGACTFSVGQLVTGATSNAHLLITAVDTTTNSQNIILGVKPQTADLQTIPYNSSLWTLQTSESISVTNGVQGASVVNAVGTGAAATIVTDGSGIVQSVNMTALGSGYYVAPYVSIASGTGSLVTLNLTAQNFIAQVNVAAVANSTGFGYGFGVTEGVIYQDDFFLEVQPQIAIIKKYSNSPDQLVVGFDTTQSIVNAATDNTLYDNALGTPNYTAPGADRLKMSPELVVLTKADSDANSNFFPIVQWTGGLPYIQNRQPAYNQITDQLAKRTFESSGDFVVDPFLINSQSPATLTLEADVGGNGVFNAIVDPGTAYVSGYRVETDSNFVQSVRKGIDTKTTNNAVVLNYNNYIRVNNRAGIFQFSTGDIVSLYDTAKSYYLRASVFTGSMVPGGNIIGQARIRSIVYESGSDAGTAGAIYRVYLFDISMSTGGNFRNVRSVYYTNATTSQSGVADIVLEIDPTTGSSIAILHNPGPNGLVFSSGQSAVKNANSVIYQYRYQSNSSANTLGMISVTAPEGTFPYGNSVVLTAGQEQDVYIVPTVNGAASVNVGGTVSVNTSNNFLIGTGTAFTTDLTVGDLVGVWSNSTAYEVHQVTTIANNTQLTLDSNSTFTNASTHGVLAFVQNIPIATSSRAPRTINTNASGTVMTISLGNTLSASMNVHVIYNVLVANAQPVSKVVNRDVFVKLAMSNNAGGTTGPWSLGVPDIFRLKGVYLDTSSAVSNTSTNVTNYFYVDHGQNEDFYDLGYLYLNSNSSSLALTSSNWLLVQFDSFTKGSNGYFDVKSYTIDDTRTLANLSTTGTYINTMEIPEFNSSTDTYYDLRDCFDFRPVAANTANLVTSSVSASITINPAGPTINTHFGNTSDPAQNKRFPVPTSTMYTTVEYYQGRDDLVTINSNNDIRVVAGTPGSNSVPPVPNNSIVISPIEIPAYPSLPAQLSLEMVKILNKQVSSGKSLIARQGLYSIVVPPPGANVVSSQPRVYTMADIGTLENRIKNLEYVVSLSALESDINSKVIPSSANSQINRFKFGFFVDNFSSNNFTNLNDPTYSASFQDGYLTARKRHLNLPFVYGANNPAGNHSILSNDPTKMALLPYTNDNSYIISQLDVTNGAISYINSVSSGNVTITSASGLTPPVYLGTVRTNPTTFDIIQQKFTGKGVPGMGQYFYSGFVSADQKFTVYVFGLKPSTVHKLYFDNVDVSAYTQYNGNPTGTALVSTSSGTLQFDYYFATPITRALNTSAIGNNFVGITNQYGTGTLIGYSAMSQFYDYLSKIIGTKNFYVQSADQTSEAFGTITITSTIVNTNAPQGLSII